MTWQNQQNECAHPPSLIWLIRVFAVHMKKSWVLSYPLSAQRRLWSDWEDALADLSLRWAHTHFVGFVMSWLICVVLVTCQNQRTTGPVLLTWVLRKRSLNIHCSPWVGTDNPSGPNFNVNRKASWLWSFVASFKRISSTSDLIHIFMIK